MHAILWFKTVSYHACILSLSTHQWCCMHACMHIILKGFQPRWPASSNIFWNTIYMELREAIVYIYLLCAIFDYIHVYLSLYIYMHVYILWYLRLYQTVIKLIHLFVFAMPFEQHIFVSCSKRYIWRWAESGHTIANKHQWYRGDKPKINSCRTKVPSIAVEEFHPWYKGMLGSNPYWIQKFFFLWG